MYANKYPESGFNGYYRDTPMSYDVYLWIKILEENFRDLEARLSNLQGRLLEAEEVIQDLIMSNDHADFCRVGYVKTYSEGCTCMDNHYYAESSILARAHMYQKKWSVD